PPHDYGPPLPPPLPPVNPNSNSHSSLLHLSFNQDYACFAAGTDNGFRIYNCDPYRELFRRDFDQGGGIRIVDMLFRCNILALVGGGPDPQYPPNKVMIWDDHKGECIGELTFRSEVRAVRLRHDRIVVVLEQKIFVYNFADLNLLHQIETVVNPKGLCAASQASGSFVLVCPGVRKGEVRVENYMYQRTKYIVAHDSGIVCFSLTQDGQLLATARLRGLCFGFLIQTMGRCCRSMKMHATYQIMGLKVDTYPIFYQQSVLFSYSVTTPPQHPPKQLLEQEIKKNKSNEESDRAEIYSLAFSSTAQWLAVSSDKGTVHVFSLKANIGNLGTDKLKSTETNLSVTPSNSSRSFIKGVLPKYFSSEWSVAQFRLLESSQYIVAFGQQKNTVAVLGLDGSFYRCKFDPATGGEMTQLEYHNFLYPEEPY
ncbi:hypothetical protein RJ639_000456, partial [Escallonia herrerae]